MAQPMVDPAPTKKELKRIVRLIKEKRTKGQFRTWAEVAAAMDIHPSELSRLLRLAPGRRWGFWGLAKIARWLGFTLDEMFDRKEGTTRVLPRRMQPGGLGLPAETLMPRSRDQIAQLHGQIRKEISELLERLEGLNEKLTQLELINEERIGRSLEFERESANEAS